MTTRRRRLLVCAVLCATCAPPSLAAAAGPPLPSSASGRAGVVAPAGSERLLTMRAGDDTKVIAVRRGDRRVLRSRTIGGRWRVAPVAFDGATTGLSADGRVLVLARPERYYPPKSTGLAVLDAGELLVRRRILLPGFFTVDAISPDGRWVYLIQYAGENALDYRVRALDTRTGRLATRDVVDPREPEEQMGGLPIARALSRDGRWAYTLYSGGEETFIHALDTVGRTAACIDLEMLPPDTDLSSYRLRLSTGGVRVVRRDGDVVATVNARTFAVTEPGEAPARRAAAPVNTSRPASPRATGGDGGFPWPALILVVPGLVFLIRRRRGRALA